LLFVLLVLLPTHLHTLCDTGYPLLPQLACITCDYHVCGLPHAFAHVYVYGSFTVTRLHTHTFAARCPRCRRLHYGYRVTGLRYAHVYVATRTRCDFVRLGSRLLFTRILPVTRLLVCGFTLLHLLLLNTTYGARATRRTVAHVRGLPHRFTHARYTRTRRTLCLPFLFAGSFYSTTFTFTVTHTVTFATLHCYIAHGYVNVPLLSSCLPLPPAYSCLLF